MKNETKIIIIESIIIIGLVIFGLCYKCGTDKNYKQLLDNNREINTRLSDNNKRYEQRNSELEKIKSEFTEYRNSTETAIKQLSENLDKAGEIISRLENDTISIQSTINGVPEATEGIRKVLTEIMDN